MTTPNDPAKPWLNSTVYDFLKLMAMIILPAVATLYFALSGIWGLPDAEKIIGTITAADSFLGIMLSITKAQYLSTNYAYDGNMVVTTDPDTGKRTASMELNDDPANIINKDQVTFKVSPQ